MPGRSTPDVLQKGAHVGKVRQPKCGIILRHGVVIPITVVIVVILLPRDCLGGRLLEGKPFEALLTSTLLQLLPLLSLADLALLGGILLLLLLGRLLASNLPSRLVL
jgi:hypothetical protein